MLSELSIWPSSLLIILAYSWHRTLIKFYFRVNFEIEYRLSLHIFLAYKTLTILFFLF